MVSLMLSLLKFNLMNEKTTISNKKTPKKKARKVVKGEEPTEHGSNQSETAVHNPQFKPCLHTPHSALQSIPRSTAYTGTVTGAEIRVWSTLLRCKIKSSARWGRVKWHKKRRDEVTRGVESWKDVKRVGTSCDEMKRVANRCCAQFCSTTPDGVLDCAWQCSRLCPVVLICRSLIAVRDNFIIVQFVLHS